MSTQKKEGQVSFELTMENDVSCIVQFFRLLFDKLRQNYKRNCILFVLLEKVLIYILKGGNRRIK